MINPSEEFALLSCMIFLSTGFLLITSSILGCRRNLKLFIDSERLLALAISNSMLAWICSSADLSLARWLLPPFPPLWVSVALSFVYRIKPRSHQPCPTLSLHLLSFRPSCLHCEPSPIQRTSHGPSNLSSSSRSPDLYKHFPLWCFSPAPPRNLLILPIPSS